MGLPHGARQIPISARLYGGSGRVDEDGMMLAFDQAGRILSVTGNRR